MATASGSGGIAGWVWGLLAGAAVAAVGGGLYLAGVFGPAPAPVSEPVSEAVSEQPAEQTAEAPPEAKPAPATDPTTEPAPAAEPGTEADPEATADVAPAAGQDSAPALPPLDAPSFDLVRVEPDGTAVIAGRATPASTVTVLLDEAEIDSFAIAGSGEFVSFVTLATSDMPRVMMLRAELDGQSVLSEDQIILAPTPRPEPEAEPKVAEAKPEEAAAEPASEATEAAPQLADAQPAEAEAPTPAAETAAAPAPQVAQSPADPATDEAKPEPVARAETTPEPAAPQIEPQAEPAATVPDSSPETTPPAPVTVLRAGADGVELVQPASAPEPEVMDQIALDTISYTESGDVLIAGRAGVLSLVRVYLDNSAVAEIAAGEDGRWQGQLTGVEPGVYILRLDEVNAAGEVLSRLETPFKREAPEALRAPATPTDSDPDGAPLVRVVTVQKGDTLWAISRDRYGEGLLYVRVFEANRERIRDPDLIYPGQVFTIPE